MHAECPKDILRKELKEIDAVCQKKYFKETQRNACQVSDSVCTYQGSAAPITLSAVNTYLNLFLFPVKLLRTFFDVLFMQMSLMDKETESLELDMKEDKRGWLKDPWVLYSIPMKGSKMSIDASYFHLVVSSVLTHTPSLNCHITSLRWKCCFLFLLNSHLYEIL